jgi:branched-chain amino acid transport system ATP-binding protein
MHTLGLPDSILRVKDVVAGYGEIRVLRGVSVDIPDKRIVTLIGANGAGKSTLLKAAFGLLSLEAGSILFEGKDISQASPESRISAGITYVPQGRSNFPRMTVRENLEMGGYTRTDEGLQQDIADQLNRFPVLKRKEGALAGTMSGGEQQILEMAMALVLHPKLLLIDEPSLGLSPKMVDLVFEHIIEINRSGVTILMVEQNARKALSVSDYAFVLELGQNRLMGTGEEILNNEEVRRMYLGGSKRARERWDRTEHVE